jgi:hypothetical protein
VLGRLGIGGAADQASVVPLAQEAVVLLARIGGAAGQEPAVMRADEP